MGQNSSYQQELTHVQENNQISGEDSCQYFISLTTRCQERSSTHALHTERINLSPFTKDFRVWGTSNEYINISFRLSDDSFITSRKVPKEVTYCRSKVQSFQATAISRWLETLPYAVE